MLLALSMDSSAQKPPKEPKRPKLAARSDTNDAHNYFNYAASKLVKDPSEAAAAFYWATRIDPTWPEGYYGRWVALNLEDPERQLSRDDADAETRQEMARIDSLRARAFMLDPFFFRIFDRTLMTQTFEWAAKKSRTVEQMLRVGVMQSVWMNGPPGKATAAYAAGNFEDALREYAKGLKAVDSLTTAPSDAKAPKEPSAEALRIAAYIHLERGRIFFLLAEYDSAAHELRASEHGKHGAESVGKELIRMYTSNAMLEQSLGIVEERLGRADSAREAYSRALEEDLSFAPAHFALAGLALAAHDTAQAVRELDLAGQLRPDDPATSFFYGRGLILAGHVPESVAPLQRAAKLEPLFAEPHVWLAFVYDGSGFESEAITEYERYLALAPVHGEHVKRATERLAAVRAALAPAAPASPP